MNYATALTLPDWATEAQVYCQQVIRFTPVVLKTFGKTIAPVIIDSVKGFSSHWFESECYWREKVTSLAGITYNPLTASIRAAHAELTSTEAQATYRHIRRITRETAMDALVIGLCGVVAVATTIDTAQAIYSRAVALYGKAQAKFKPATVIVPTVEMAYAATSDEEIAAIVKDIRVERYFMAQFDQLDSDVLAINAEEIDEAIVQVMIAQLKSARAELALSVEGDRLAREALDYIVDQAERFAMVEQQAVAEAPAVDALAASLEVPGATGGKQRKAKASTGVAAAKPKPTRARAAAAK